VRELPALVVVSGPPGAGKTAIAAALRERLALPLIAKDALKETLGERLPVSDRASSQQLGVATFAVQFAVLRELLAAGVSAIAEGNFGRDWFATLPRAQIVEVHVSAAPETLRKRLLARDKVRHAVHYDREAADEIAARAAAGDWGPLELGGSVLTVDTTSAWPDVEALAEEVATRLR